MFYYPINYKIFGKGKSFVLFLHGWGGSTNSFLSIAKKLSLSHKVGLIDFYGFGNSKYPNKALDTYEYALNIYLFLKNKNITNLSIVAHSFGGRIAILLASVFNVKIDRLVLVDSAGLTPRRGIKYNLKVLKYKLTKKLVAKNLLNKNKLSKYGSVEYKKLNDLQKVGYVKIVNQDLGYVLTNITAPTLLVWGKEDTTTPVYMAKKLNKSIKNSSIYYYLNSGHFSYLENYVNFCNLLSMFLREQYDN